MDVFEKLKEQKLVRRFAALFFHLLGIAVSFQIALLLRFDFHWDTATAYFENFILPVSSGFFVSFYLFRLYRGMWRFFTLRDCYLTAVAIVLGAILSGAVIFVSNQFSFLGFPRSTLLISCFVLLVWEIGFRGSVRLAREQFRRGKGGEHQRVLLMGSPEEADSLLRGLVRYPDRIGQVYAIVSHVNRHSGQVLRGVKIFGRDTQVSGLIREGGVSTVLFLPPLNTPAIIKQTLDQIGEAGLKCDYRIIPSMDDLASGRLSVEQMRKVSIEDLLHRPPHMIDFETVRSSISGRNVLVTGAGGSIGSEICRQILKLGPRRLVLFDVSEFLLFEIERELLQISGEIGDKRHDGLPEIVAITGDVRRADHVERALGKPGDIDVIYHAAAYKHVHMMENNPMACLGNNVVGTHNVATAAEAFGVSEFVLISTDKAVRPTSIMGASKRLAERVITERPRSSTHFKAVRFGNVLGSSGSVIPIFREQIREGKAVTVTSKEVTRYFMTIPEAVELVIAAGAVAEDRRICVLEMGEPVKIDSLARRMIELSGFIPDVDIPVVYTGLKPGEKEFEELLTDDEGVVRTDHDQIWVVEKASDRDVTPLSIGELLEVIDAGDVESLRKFVHENVPGSLLY